MREDSPSEGSGPGSPSSWCVFLRLPAGRGSHLHYGRLFLSGFYFPEEVGLALYFGSPDQDPVDAAEKEAEPVALRDARIVFL